MANKSLKEIGKFFNLGDDVRDMRDDIDTLRKFKTRYSYMGTSKNSEERNNIMKILNKKAGGKITSESVNGKGR